MQQLFRMRDADGNDYDVPNSDMAEFSGAVPNAANVTRYRDANGNDYDVPDADKAEFSAAVPNAQPLRRVSFANGTTRDFTMPEMAKFLRSKEWRESDDYKADREERDRAVASRISGGVRDDSSFLEEYSKGLADAGGTAIGRTLGGALSRFAKFTGFLAANARPMGTESTLSNREFHPDNPDASPIQNARNNPGMLVGDAIDGVTDILFPAAPQTDSVVAQSVGKAVGLGAGLAEFALTPTVVLAGGHLAEGWEQTFDAAKARGATDEEASALGVMRGSIDAAITTAFKNAPTQRILSALGYKPSPAVLNALAKAGEKGIAGVSRGSIATAVGKQMLANAVISAFEMGSLGGLQGYLDNIVEQEAATGEIDWDEALKVGFSTAGEQAAFGATMGLLPTAFKVREAIKQRDAMLKDTLADPLGVVAYAHANPAAADTLAQAWRKDGKVSRRVARDAGLPEMDEGTRNGIGETIALINDTTAKSRRARPDEIQSKALDDTIKGIMGGEENASKIREKVLSRIDDAKTLDDPQARERLVEEAANEVYGESNDGATRTKVGGREAERAAAEKRAADNAAAEHRAKSMAGMEERARRKAEMAEYEKQEAERKAREEAEQNAPRITVSDLPAETPAAPAEKPSAPAETGRGQFPEYYEWLDKTGKKDSDKNWRKFVAENDLDPALAGKRPEPPAERPAVKPDGKGKMVPVEPEAPAEEAKKPEVAAEPPQEPVETRPVAETGKETPEPAKPVETPSRASDAKPVPDGKGKMVKPKAAESDYGITMSKEPSVDGDGVRYVVKDGPGDAHRMMFNSKAEAEARLGELRAERRAIQESPSATLSDGKKVRLLKTDEGWVPYDENYNDLRHGMFKAAKTKAEAVEVAEKGVKWARDVAEENARLKAESAKPKPDGKGKMVKPAAQKKPVKANPKKAAKVVEEFVSKDKTRASLQSVFHDHENGVAVASDGRVLIATKHGYDPNAKRDPENPFPNWKQIVPDYSKGSYEHIERVVENGKSSLQQKWLDVQEAEVDPAAISSACKKAAALANKIKHSDPVYVRFELPDGKSMIFDGANLRRVADAMAANGITKIKAVGPKAPLLAENADTTILAMPLKFGDADFKPGRGGEHFVIDARTGRVLSAPERSDNVAMFSREWASDLRRQIAKGKAETIDYVKKSGLFKEILDAVKRGETDAKTVYEGLPGGASWEKLSQTNKDALAECLKLKDENAIAEKLAEHLADSNIDSPRYSWRKKLPSELEKIEKRIAAEDEIDSLMSDTPVAPKPAETPAKRVPDGKGKMVKPEVAKPSEPTPLQKFLSDRPKGLAKKAEQNLNRQINRGNGKYSSDLEEVERAVGTKAYIDTFGDGKGKTYYQINHADGTSETISKTAADYAISRGIESRIEKPTETRELTDREKYDAAKEKYRKAQEEAKKSDGKTPIDKELGSILDSNSPMGVNVRDAATEIIERLTEKYGEGVADELDAHFGKFFKDIEKDNMRRSRAESLIRAFVNSLPRKYELDGWREEIAPRKFEKMGLPDADSIQERLLDLTDEFYGTDFEETFAPLKFRKIDEAKLSAKDKAAFGKLRNEFEDAIDDLEKSLDLVSTETRTGERRIRGEVQQDVVDTFTSARENVERFLEQAEKYQALKRDKKGRPLFSLAPDGELDFFTEPKNEKAKLQRIEPVASEPAKSPEQEIAERLDLKRLDPKLRSDPKVLAWAKKNGRNIIDGKVTPDAARAYYEEMTHATAKLALRWFPDMKPMEHKFGEDIKRGVHVIDLRDTSGGVLGWFDPKSKEVHLLPGADPKTVAHEIMWHGTRQYMTDLAAKGDARAQNFLDMMHDVEKNAPQAIKDLVNRIYARGGKAISRDTLLNEYGAWFTMGKGGEALEQALQKAENRNWFARGLHTVKEMVKDFLTAHGRNRVDFAAIDGMTRDEFVDFLAKEFSSGKTLGNIKGKQPPTLSTKETALQRYKRRFYDQNAAVRDLERDIEKKTGKKISADDSVEAANALKYGLKEAANIETQGEKREFIKVLSETGIHYEDFEYYAALKAAAGRDAKIDARNIAKLTAKLRSEGASAQDIADAIARYKTVNGSHIDPREAKMMLNEIENGPDAAKFKKAYDAIRPIIDATLDTQVKAGLVGATEAAQWRTEEPYYIPFKNEYDAETGEWAGRGMSRNYAKPEHYTAKGRQSAAGDILAHIFMDHQAAKLRAIENGVRQKLANLVRANPELGKVEVLGDNEAGIEASNPNVVVFKDGGRAYKITLEGTRGEAIANAFTQRNQLKMGWADRKFMGVSMRGFARGTAGMATRYSPTFAVRNTTKDNIELANIVYSERGPIEGSKFMGRYIASRAQMAGTLAKYITTGKIDATTAHGKILDRYIKAGGLIAGGTRAEAFDSIKKSLTPEAIAKEMRRGNSKTRAVAKHVLNSIGYLNEYAEMATRVGIFDAEIKAGKSDAEAALFARRATVDFNRHGDWTPAFNMFRLFSNSTLGASARAAAALTKSKYGAAAMGALFVNGLARAFIDHFVNADEDERRRKTGEATGKDISEYERRTSLFYFRNGDKLYKVAEHESPFSLISYAGDCVGRWICGDLDGKQVAKNLGVTTAEVAYNFLPMGSINLTAQNGGFAEDAKAALISGVVPTAAQPIAELWANVDYAGRTIYNDPGHDDKTPRAEQGRDSTPDWAKEAAVKLNESTRSEGSRKGYVDIPPEAIQKLVEGYGKNALRDVSMAVSIGEAIIKGDFSRLDPRNKPVKRDFVRPLDGNDKRFIAATKEFEANLDYFKKTEMTEDERVDYLAKFPHIRGKRGSDLLAAIKKFRKRERGFSYKNGKAVPHEWPQEKLDEFKEKRRALQAQFLELMGDK